MTEQIIEKEILIAHFGHFVTLAKLAIKKFFYFSIFNCQISIIFESKNIKIALEKYRNESKLKKIEFKLKVDL